MTATDNATTRLAEIEARVANPNQMNVNQLHAVVQDDVPWLIAELRAAREVIAWYADPGNLNDGDCSHGHYEGGSPDIMYEDAEWIRDCGDRARTYLNRGAE